MNVQTFNNMSSWISAEPSLKNKVLLQAYYYRSESFDIRKVFLDTYFPDDFFLSLVSFFILFSFFISAISLRNYGFVCFSFFIMLFIFSFQSHALALALFYSPSHIQLFSILYISRSLFVAPISENISYFFQPQQTDFHHFNYKNIFSLYSTGFQQI